MGWEREQARVCFGGLLGALSSDAVPVITITRAQPVCRGGVAPCDSSQRLRGAFGLGVCFLARRPLAACANWR
jgi:hypothetical protein